MPYSHTFSLPASFLGLLAVLLALPWTALTPASAQIVTWDDAAPGDGEVTTPGNWLGGTAPGAGDTAVIDLGGANIPDTPVGGPPPAIPAPTLGVATHSGSAIVTYNQLRVGDNANGRLEIAGGTMEVVTDVVLGYNSTNGSNGILVLNGGSLLVGDDLILGRRNTGAASGDGFAWLESGVLDVDQVLIGGDNANNNRRQADGIMSINGGLLMARNTGNSIIVGQGGEGDLVITGGEVRAAGSVLIANGDRSQGTLTMSGGLLTLNGNIGFQEGDGEGNNSTIDQVLTLSGGTILTSNIQGGNVAPPGFAGRSVVNFDGGVAEVTDSIVNRGAPFVLNYNGTQLSVGGTLTADELNIGTSGPLTVSQIAGPATAANEIGVGLVDVGTLAFASDSTYALENGVLMANNGVSGGGSAFGTLNVDGGTLAITGARGGPFDTRPNTNSEIGNYVQSGAGALDVTLNGGGANHLIATNATVDGSLNVGVATAADTSLIGAALWTAGNGVWTSSGAEWQTRNPASGVTIVSNGDEFVIIDITGGSLTDNGIVATAGWAVTSTNGDLNISRSGSDVTGGPVLAVLDAAAVTFSGELKLGANDAGAVDAAALQVNAGASLEVTGGNDLVLGDGNGAAGPDDVTSFVEQSGDVTVSGNLLFGNAAAISTFQGGRYELLGGALNVAGAATTNPTASQAEFAVNGGTLNVAGNIDVIDFIVGDDGKSGAFTLSNPAQTIAAAGRVEVGFQGGSLGSMTLAGGLLSTNGLVGVGFNGGTGVFNATGGTLLANNLRAGGSNNAGNGLVSIGSAGGNAGDVFVLTANGSSVGDGTTANPATGAIVQHSGTFVTGSGDAFVMADGESSVGTYVMNGGLATFNRDINMQEGTSVFEINGGSVTVTRDFAGNLGDGSGDLIVNGGVLQIDRDLLTKDGAGTFNTTVAGGTILIGNGNNDAIELDGGNSTLSVSAGLLQTNEANGTRTLLAGDGFVNTTTVSGGTWNILGAGGDLDYGAGTSNVTVSGGVARFGGSLLMDEGQGSFTASGSAQVTATSVLLSTAGGTAHLIVADTAILNIGNDTGLGNFNVENPNATHAITGGRIQPTVAGGTIVLAADTVNHPGLTLGGSAVLDLRGGELTDAGADPNALIISGSAQVLNARLLDATITQSESALIDVSADDVQRATDLESSDLLSTGGSLQLDIFTGPDGGTAGTTAANSGLHDITNLQLTGTAILIAANGIDSLTFMLGDQWDFLDFAGVTGAFTPDFGVGNANLPGLAGGLAWDTSQFGVDGSLVIIPEPAPAILLFLGAALFLRRRPRGN